MKKRWKAVVSLIVVALAFWAIVPQVQSSPATTVRFLPMGAVGFILFAAGMIIGRQDDEPVLLLVMKCALFLVFSIAVFERVRLGVL